MGAKERLFMHGFRFLSSVEDASDRKISEAADRRKAEKILEPRVLKISRPVRRLTCIPLDSMKALEHTTAAADPSAVGADMASVIGLHMVFDSLIYLKGISFLRHAYGLCTLCL